ncbi:MAG: phenylalanine--tRNA ligase subunit beta [Lachnospiraceae bacterium]
MNTSIAWIKAYVPELDVTPEEYADAMTLSGTKVEGFEDQADGLERIFVGQILKIEKHPDADKLVVCQVDVGTGEAIQIVTGASNIKEGDKVPVVLDGGSVACDHDGHRVAGGVKIKKGKLRGIVSNGMMCSIQELGSDCNLYPEAPSDGIYLFDEAVTVGADAVKELGLDDVVFEYEITSNRVDCFSIIGIAREAAATFQKPFLLPKVVPTGNGEQAEDYIKIQVENKELCKRYTARVVKNVKLAPSPKWMQRRLASQGIRPINNIVDITNYVMEEFGQPMHAYDITTIEGNEIIVRLSQKGEQFTTLDGQNRTLTDTTLMICDSKKPIGIAGIMGGENSMITEQVNTVVFESACFDGTNIRLNSKKIGLRTDASGKFEKGLDPNQTQTAIDRACQLIEEFGAGEVVGGCVDVYPEKKEGTSIAFEPDKINKLLGTQVDKATMISIFETIDLEYDKEKEEIKIPSWRQDLHEMPDLAEEVARFVGYDKIPITLPGGSAAMGKTTHKADVEKIAKTVARYSGFSQAMCYSFESPKVFEKLLLKEDSKLRRAVTISNPLGEDFSIMRTTTLNGMLTSLSNNYNRRNKNVRLFELGNIYCPKELPITQLPEERMQLTLGMYGEGDFFELKGVVEEIIEECKVLDPVDWIPEKELEFLHPGKSARLMAGEVCLGIVGEVHPSVLLNYSIKEAVYLAILDMENITACGNFERKFKGIVKFPAVNRDISLVMPKEILAGEVEKTIRKNGGSYLENVELFDLYEGNQITAGYKSIAYSISFRGKDRTLDETDVSTAMEKISKALSDMGMTLRQ